MTNVDQTIIIGVFIWMELVGCTNNSNKYVSNVRSNESHLTNCFRTIVEPADTLKFYRPHGTVDPVQSYLYEASGFDLRFRFDDVEEIFIESKIQSLSQLTLDKIDSLLHSIDIAKTNNYGAASGLFILQSKEIQEVWGKNLIELIETKSFLISYDNEDTEWNGRTEFLAVHKKVASENLCDWRVYDDKCNEILSFQFDCK